MKTIEGRTTGGEPWLNAYAVAIPYCYSSPKSSAFVNIVKDSLTALLKPKVLAIDRMNSNDGNDSENCIYDTGTHDATANPVSLPNYI